MNHFEFLEARIAILEFAFGEVIKAYGQAPGPDTVIFFQALANILEIKIAGLNEKMKSDEASALIIPPSLGKKLS